MSLAPAGLAGSWASTSSLVQKPCPGRVAEREGEGRAQPPAPSPLTDSCNLLGKISFFSAQEKILVVPITRKTKSSAGHQRLPEAGNNVQGAQWRSPSWEAEGEPREDTGLGLSGRRGWGVGEWDDRSRNLEKRFPPQNLEVWAVELYPGNDSGPAHVPERGRAPSAQVL